MAFLDVAFGVTQLDNSSNTLVDITDQVKSLRLTVEGNSQEFFTLGEWFAFVSDSKKRWSAELVIYASDASGETEAYGLIKSWYIGNDQPGNRTLQVDTPDSTTGSFRYSGEVKCTSVSPLVEIDAAGGKPQEVTVRLMGNGALTQSVIA